MKLPVNSPGDREQSRAVAKETFCFFFCLLEHYIDFPARSTAKESLQYHNLGGVLMGALIHLQRGYNADRSVVSRFG